MRFALFLLALLLVPVTAQAAPPAKTILDGFDDLYRGSSAAGRMTMEVVKPRYTRTLTMDFWSLGKDLTLVRITSPKKEQGMATLKNHNDIWNYLPKVNRTIKVPASMMGGSWMGSDFTNDDLVKENRMAEEYTARLSFEGDRSGHKVYELTCVPKPTAAVVWGKVVVRVEQGSLLPLEARYFKENGALARTLTFSDPKPFPDHTQPANQGGSVATRTIPTKLVIVPEGKPGQRTVVTYDTIEFGAKLSPQRFRLNSLRR